MSASVLVLHGKDGRTDGVILQREVVDFKTEFYLLKDGKQVRIPLPLKTEFDGYVNGRLIFTLKEEVAGRPVRRGDRLQAERPWPSP